MSRRADDEHHFLRDPWGIFCRRKQINPSNRTRYQGTLNGCGERHTMCFSDPLPAQRLAGCEIPANGFMAAQTLIQTYTPRACRRLRKGRLATPRQRRAGVVLELLLSLPVLLIALLAAIQFGILFGGLHQLSLASRIGAREAAETAGLPTVNGPVPANIVQAIGRQMSQLGINSFGVLVEHNVANPQPMNPILLSSGSPVPTPPSTPLPGSGQYVRVSVAVDLTEVMPDLLGFFGFNILGDTVQKTTVFRYEL